MGKDCDWAAALGCGNFLCIILFNFTTWSRVDNFAALQTRKLNLAEINYLYSLRYISLTPKRTLFKLHKAPFGNNVSSSHSLLPWWMEIALIFWDWALELLLRLSCSLFYFSESQEIWPNFIYFSKLPSHTRSVVSFSPMTSWRGKLSSQFRGSEQQTHKGFLF